MRNNFKHINISEFNFGIDIDFWQSDKSKQQARQTLNIPIDKYIIFLSQRLVPEYQIEKFIQTISRIKSNNDFACFISGHGEKEYELYLKKLVQEYKVEHLINFIGYVSEEELKKYFIACDVFATVPVIFAGSMGAIKAMACERPIIHVKVGSTYEYLKENNAGVFLDPNDYDQWKQVFEEIIDGKEIKLVPRTKVTSYYSWEKTAKDILYAIHCLGGEIGLNTDSDNLIN